MGRGGFMAGAPLGAVDARVGDSPTEKSCTTWNGSRLVCLLR